MTRRQFESQTKMDKIRVSIRLFFASTTRDIPFDGRLTRPMFQTLQN